jgi:hypothetical protein
MLLLISEYGVLQRKLQQTKREQRYVPLHACANTTLPERRPSFDCQLKPDDHITAATLRRIRTASLKNKMQNPHTVTLYHCSEIKPSESRLIC